MIPQEEHQPLPHLSEAEMESTGPKRSHSALLVDGNNDSTPSLSNKRHRGNNHRRRQQNPKDNDAEHPEAKRDPTYGQQFVFPGLDDEFTHPSVGDDWEFEDTGDALAYLRAVR